MTVVAVSIHHAFRSHRDKFHVFHAFSGAQDVTTTRLAIHVTAARCGCIRGAAFFGGVRVADMLRDLLGPAFSHHRGGAA